MIHTEHVAASDKHTYFTQAPGITMKMDHMSQSAWDTAKNLVRKTICKVSIIDHVFESQHFETLGLELSLTENELFYLTVSHGQLGVYPGEWRTRYGLKSSQLAINPTEEEYIGVNEKLIARDVSSGLFSTFIKKRITYTHPLFLILSESSWLEPLTLVGLHLLTDDGHFSIVITGDDVKIHVNTGLDQIQHLYSAETLPE